MLSVQAGSLWQYTIPVEQTVSVWIRDELNKSTTVRNFEMARIMVIASIRNVSISGVKKAGFACFMPTPMVVDRLFFYESSKSVLKSYCN